MSTGVVKSRSPVERSYSSASSTTSSRRSARRKRRRMKHTVMPLKKRAGKREEPCDVHRVSNLDIEEMEQSACFWVAKNADNPVERNFKEELFVNKDAPSSDEDMSFYEERSHITEDITQENYKTRTDTRYESQHTDEKEQSDAFYANEKEKFDANYANEAGDPRYFEEKTFYGVRKGTTSDGTSLERVSPLPSPRSRSRGSYSDDGQSGFSSEGQMRVGWTSDVGASSGPEYWSGESDGEGGTRSSTGEFYGYRRKDGDKRRSEFPTRKLREQNNNEGEIVVATDITSTEVKQVQNFENEERKYESRENGEFYAKDKEEILYSDYNGGGFAPRSNTNGDIDSKASSQREEVPLPGGKTNNRNIYPSSDTELVNFRSFDIEIERQSDRSLPLGGHKTKTQYYSVEDLMRAAKEEEEAGEKKQDSGSDGPEIPRTYEDHEDYAEIPHEEPEPRPGVVTSAYEVTGQRPLLVPRKDKEFDGTSKENSQNGKPDDRTEMNEDKYIYEESKEFYGYRRVHSGKEYESANKENLSPQYDKEDSVHPTKDENNKQTRAGDEPRDSPTDSRVRPEDDQRIFEESREFRGYRHPKPGEKSRSDTRPGYEENTTSGGQSTDAKFEETKEFYAYRNAKTEPKPGKSPRYEHVSGKPPPGNSWEQNKNGSRQSRATTRTVTTSSEFYGYRRTNSSENISSNQDGKTLTTSQEVFGFRKTGSLENISSQDGRDGQKWEQSHEVFGFRSGSTENIAKDSSRGAQQSREFYGFRSKTGSKENIPQDASRKAPDNEIWEESKEFFGFRRRQVVDDGSHVAVSGYHRPQSSQVRRLEASDQKPLRLESADDVRKRDANAKNESGRLESNEHVTTSTPVKNLMSVDDERDKNETFEESKEFYGYRRGEQKASDETRSREEENSAMIVDDDGYEESKFADGYRTGEDVPRSAAYDEYQRPGTELPPEKDYSIKDQSRTTRSYDVTTKSTRYTEQSTRETHVRGYSPEPEIKDTRTEDVHMQPDDTPGDYDSWSYDPTGDKDPGDVARDRHMFNILEIPSSKKVIPLVSDVAPGFETTETTKRLHTQSEREALRREAGLSEKTTPESSDLGMKMFRQRSLPRKHGHPISSDEKTKELPRKMKKSTDEPDLTRVNPDFAEKFREITEKRQKKANTNTVTKTTTKSAAENYNKNVEELVNVFNTLEHIQGKKGDKTVFPSVCRLEAPSAEDGKVPPVTSISHSVDKNSQRSKKHDYTTRQEKYSESDTQRTTKTTTTRETTREDTRDKHGWRPDDHDVITKQEAMDVESFVSNESSRRPPARRGRQSEIPEQNQPWSYTPYIPERRSKGYEWNFRSRDDDDEIYRAQIRKGREEKWRGSRSSRKKKYDSKSDGEIEGFKSRPFGDRVITPGTPVNIRLYGMNINKTNQDRSSELNWEIFTNSEVPVSENIDQTQLESQPFNIKQIPGVEKLVDETVDKTQMNRLQFQVGQIPKDEARIAEPTIDRSHMRPALDVNFPSEEQDQDMHAQHEPLYIRQQQLPQKRHAPNSRSDLLGDAEDASQEIKWSHPPVSKARLEKEPRAKVPRADTTEENEKGPQQDKPSERYPSMTRPYEKQPLEKRPSNKRTTEKRPSSEGPDDEIPIKTEQVTETNEQPDGLVIEIQYTEIDEDENKPLEQNTRREQSTVSEESSFSRKDNVLRSSAPKDKPRSPGRNDDIYDEDSHHKTHEESSSSQRHESHETHVDHTVHTTRTTKTTRTETTETIVKRYRTPGSGPETSGPDFIVPVRSEPDSSEPASSRPETKPEHFTPSNQELITPEISQPDYAEPECRPPQPDVPDGEKPSDEPSLIAHEYIVMNKDTGGPVNLTVLGRVDDHDDEDYLSSHSREDLFLHTRLKMMTEKKKTPTQKRPDDAHLIEPNTADQDNVENEGALTDSDEEFDTNEQASEQLLIPISGKIHERIKKDQQNKPSQTADIFTPQEQVDESVFKIDHAAREETTHDSFVFIPEPVSEIVDSTRKPDKPEVVSEFGEPIGDKEKQKDKIKDIEIVEFPIFDDFNAESVPSDEAIIPPEKVNEEISEERTTTPTLPELKHETIDETITAEKHDKNLNIPDIPGTKPVEPIDEVINPSAQASRDVCIPDIDEAFPEMRKPATPVLIDETVASEEKNIEINLPIFGETKPSQPIDEDVVLSEPIGKEVYIPDFQEFIPENEKPVIPVDENVSSKKRENDIDLPELQIAEPEREASEPITEQINVDEPITSEVHIPEFSEIEFQEVVPEFPESKVANDDREVPCDDDAANVELPGFQEAVQEPVRNFATTESDLEVEASSISQDLSEDEPDAAKTPEKDTPEKDTPEKDTPEKDTLEETMEKDTSRRYKDETWSETIENKTVRETRTTETVTVEEKTVRKYVSPPKKNEPVSPSKTVPFAGPIESKDSGESSAETSPQSSGASADASSEVTPEVDKSEVLKRSKRRRGNRFDNVKKSGSLVPELVVREESPEEAPVVVEREQPVFSVPECTPREKIGQMRPEMYLLDSDDENKGEDVNEPKEEEVLKELCVSEEKVDEEGPRDEGVPGEDEMPPRDELSPELIDELLENEVLGLDEEKLEAVEVVEEVLKDEVKQPDLQDMPYEEPIEEQITESILPENKLLDDDTPQEINEDIQKSVKKEEPQFSGEEDGQLLPREEIIEKAIKVETQEESSQSEPEEKDEDVYKTSAELIPRDENVQVMVLPEFAREEPQEKMPNETPEKSGPEENAVQGTEDFEIILIEHLKKDDDVNDTDDATNKDDEVGDKDDDITDKNDDVTDKDDDFTVKDDGVIVTDDKEDNFVETVIIEKTHSKVSTAVTEITTTKYPSLPTDIPTTTSNVPEDPKESPSDDEIEYVIILPDKPNEIAKPSEVEVVEGIPDEQPTYKEKATEDHPSSESDKESSDSRSSAAESDDERTDSSVGKVAKIDSPEKDEGTETVFGIVEIKYEKPEEIFIIDTNIEIQEIPEVDPTKSSELESEVPEYAPIHDDVPIHENVATSEHVPFAETPDEQLNIVPEDKSSPDEEDERVPQRIPDSTVETIIVEKTSTQISTTITEITDESEETRKDVCITFAPDDGVPSEEFSTPENSPTFQDIPTTEHALMSEACPIEPAAEDILTDKVPERVTPQENTNEKLTLEEDTHEKVTSEEASHEKVTPEEDTHEKVTPEENTCDKRDTPEFDISIVVKSESPSSSSTETSDDDQTKSQTTVETIVVEKTHSNVSTTITEITSNTPHYPPGSPTYAQVVAGETRAHATEFPINEDIPKSEFTPTFQGYPIPSECFPMAEVVPETVEVIPKDDSRTETPDDETKPTMDYSDTLATEILHEVGDIRYIETQTESNDVYSETTQTDGTTKKTDEMTTQTEGTSLLTQDASSMTPKRTISDSEIQTEIAQDTASTQTNYQDSQWQMNTRTIEELQESTEIFTSRTGECFDHETQTDVSNVTAESGSMTDDDLRVIPTTHEGTQTEEGRWENEVTRITRRTTTETRTEDTYERRISPRKDIKSDCPVCLQSLDATNYSFIKVKDLSRFAAMEERSSQYEETTHTSLSSTCGRHGTRRDIGGDSSTMDEESGQIGYSRDQMEYEKSEREGSGYTGEADGFSSTIRDIGEYSRTTKEERKEVVESSTEASSEAHFSIRIDGDEKCLLYCRRPGKHACALEKLAAIIEAYRKSTTSSTAETEQTSESGENVVSGESGDNVQPGTSDMIGQQRRDVSVQTDSTLLPADFEVFSDKDFEIYYDVQKSPWFV